MEHTAYTAAPVPARAPLAALALAVLGIATSPALAVPIRPADFTEHERVLSLGMEDETNCEPQAGDDLLPEWYWRVAGAPFGVVAQRAPWDDESRLGLQLAFDAGRTRRPWFDVHLAAWGAESGAAAAAIEGRWTVPVCGIGSAVVPYLGTSLVSDRVRRLEFDHDATAWAGAAALTPNLYPWVLGSRLGNPDRFDVRLRLAVQAEAPTDPAPSDWSDAVRPHYWAGVHGMLGWTVLRGFSVTHERRRAPLQGTRERISSLGVYFGSAEARFHPFVRGRWLRTGGRYADDLTVGVAVRLMSN